MPPRRKAMPLAGVVPAPEPEPTVKEMPKETPVVKKTSEYAPYFPAVERYLKGEISYADYKVALRKIAGPGTGRFLFDMAIEEYKRQTS